MNKLVQLVLQVLVAMITEVLLRKLDNTTEADVAEAAMIASTVALAHEAIDAIPGAPQWLKDAIKNPVVLANVAKWVNDQIEKSALDGLKALEAQGK